MGGLMASGRKRKGPKDFWQYRGYSPEQRAAYLYLWAQGTRSTFDRLLRRFPQCTREHHDAFIKILRAGQCCLPWAGKWGLASYKEVIPSHTDQAGEPGRGDVPYEYDHVVPLHWMVDNWLVPVGRGHFKSAFIRAYLAPMSYISKASHKRLKARCSSDPNLPFLHYSEQAIAVVRLDGDGTEERYTPLDPKTFTMKDHWDLLEREYPWTRELIETYRVRWGREEGATDDWNPALHRRELPAAPGEAPSEPVQREAKRKRGRAAAPPDGSGAADGRLPEAT
jgi:hypothetical protein